MKHRIYKIAAALLALFALLSLAGCNNATTPGEAVQYFTEEMNATDFRGAFEYVDGYDNFSFSKGSEDIMSAVSKSMIINVIDESSTSSSATLTVDITTVDLRKAYIQAAEQVIPSYYAAAVSGGAIDESEVGVKMVEKVVEIAGSADAPMITTRCSLKLIADDSGKWYIKLDNISYSAITGFIDEANNLITTGSISSQFTPADGGEAPDQGDEPVSSDTDTQ